MAGEHYPTKMTDDEWHVLEPLISPAKPGGRTHVVDIREVIKAIRFLQCTGYAWRLLPNDLPPWETVDAYFAGGRRAAPGR